jgi:hypothetical protein
MAAREVLAAATARSTGDRLVVAVSDSRTDALEGPWPSRTFGTDRPDDVGTTVAARPSPGTRPVVERPPLLL